MGRLRDFWLGPPKPKLVRRGDGRLYIENPLDGGNAILVSEGPPDGIPAAASGADSWQRDRADRSRYALAAYVDYCREMGYFIPLSISEQARIALEQPRF